MYRRTFIAGAAVGLGTGYAAAGLTIESRGDGGAGPWTEASGPAPTPTPSPDPPKGLADELAAMSNALRERTHGRGARLSHDGTLAELAAFRARRMAGGGAGPLAVDYSRFGLADKLDERAADRINDGLESACTVARGDGAAGRIVSEWRAGAGDATLLLEGWQSHGIGVAVSDGEVHAVQNYL